ncbi:hypothetical protein EHI42_24245 [Rhizobium hidalgonense]|uniref:hypothetical protein n=1 Tax=Rhizobium hidalgonense TaxID=1538159 RepID=UPI000FEC3E13|nr:hypothetical protein [Rhizobium hidalgonense]RWX11386.1 hypothetical protein EHI42_24245 [Rhizobium hidalgonense]
MKKGSNELTRTTNAIIYGRFSSPIQEPEEGSESQEQGCRQYAERCGYKVETVSTGHHGGKQ